MFRLLSINANLKWSALFNRSKHARKLEKNETEMEI